MASTGAVWRLYKKTVEMPAATENLSKIAGISLYVLCLIGGAVLILLLYSGKEQTYVKSFESEKGDYTTAVEHRLPDLIVCPHRPQNSTYKFNAWYNQMAIEALEMPSTDVDELAQLAYDKCPLDTACETDFGECSGKFRDYCAKAEKLTNDMIPSEQGQMIARLKEAAGKWKLDLLWLLILEKNYATIAQRYWETTNQILKYPPLQFFLYDGREKEFFNLPHPSFHLFLKDVWLEGNLCILMEGGFANATRTPYFSAQRKVHKDYIQPPFRYWIGSLETMRVSESVLTSSNFQVQELANELEFQTRRSSIVHYSMIEMITENSDEGECVAQEHLRGFGCVPQEGEKWYYDVSFDTKRILMDVWIYPGTKQTIRQDRTYTPYTKFQVAIGIFGMCVGFSFFQVVEVVLSFVSQKVTSWKKPLVVGRWVLYIVVGATAVTLSVLDTWKYLGEDRYSSEFSIVQTQQFPIPHLRFCQETHHSFSFWNISKFHDYQLSVDAAAFVQMYVWLKTKNAHAPFNARPGSNNSLYDGNIYRGAVYVTYPWQVRNFPWSEEYDVVSNNDEEVVFVCAVDQCDDIFNFTTSVVFWEKTIFFRQKWMAGPNFNPVQYNAFAESMVNELTSVASKFSFAKPDADFAMVDFAQPLVLNPSEFMTCNGRDCGELFEHRMEQNAQTKNAPVFCLVMEPKADVEGMRGVGIENGLEILIDSNKYLRESDANAYYGPGTQKEQSKAWPLGGCTPEAPLFECDAPHFTSFELHLLHPEGDFGSTTLQLDKFGLSGVNGYSVNLQKTFNSKLSDCLPVEETVCKFPKPELVAVTMAIQIEIAFGCAYCINRNPRFLWQVKLALGRDFHCCGVREFLTRYGELSRAVTMKENGEYDLSNGAGEAIFSLHRDYEYSVDGWRDLKSLDSFFIQGYRLGNETQQSIIRFFNQCLKKRCDEKGLKVAMMQSIPTQNKQDKVVLFYGKSEAEGTIEMDRFDPNQFLGVLSCAYSFTFGISLVGICDVLVNIAAASYAKRRQSKFKTAQAREGILRKHILRSMGILLESQTAKIDPELRAPSALAARAEDNDRAKEVLKEMEAKIKTVIEKGMFGFLVIWTVCTIVFVAFFILYGNQTDVNIEIVDKPIVNVPSIGICAAPEDLDAFITESRCTVFEAGMGCAKVFTVFWKNENVKCAMVDNSRAFHTLDQLNMDFQVETPVRLSKMKLWVDGLNKTDLETQITKANVEWLSESISLVYTVTLNLDETGNCIRDTEEIRCPACERTIQEGEICCEKRKVWKPHAVVDSCYLYDYTLVIDTVNPVAEGMKTFTLSPKSDIVTSFIKRKKSGTIIDLCSVGGLVGTFIELSLLNLVSIFAWMTASVFFRKKKEEAEPKEDVVESVT